MKKINHRRDHLQMVVDNDPGYRLKPIDQRILENKQQEYEAEVTELKEEHQQELRQQRKAHLKLGGVVIAAVSCLTGAYMCKYNWSQEPAKVIPLNQDLNKDGVPDAYILQEGGHKKPMYGVQTQEGITYVSARDLKKRADNILDYQNIEDKLNR